MPDVGFLLKHTPLQLVLLALLAIEAVRWERSLRRRLTSMSPWDGVKRFATSVPVLVALCAGGAVAVAMNLYIAYESPRDIVQEIASVDLLLRHQSAYQIPLTPEVDTLLAKAPPPASLGRRFPALGDLEARELLDTETSHWVDAHPPAAVLLTAPFVVAFGVRGASLAFSLFSLGCGIASLVMLFGELAPGLTRRGQIAVASATACWLPWLSVLRNAQVGLVTLVLFVGALVALRRRRPTAAGICLGIATALRLYPGFLLGYLLLRSRRALVAAIVTLAVCFAIVLGVFGPGVIGEYLATGRFVLARYGSFFGNLSLLGAVEALRRNAGLLMRLPLEAGVVLTVGMAGLVYLLLSMRSTPEHALTNELRDLEFATFVPGVVLFAPVAWDHHLVILLLPLFVLGHTLIATESSWPSVVTFIVVVAAVAASPQQLTMIPATVGLAVWLYGLYLVRRNELAVGGDGARSAGAAVAAAPAMEGQLTATF